MVTDEASGPAHEANDTDDWVCPICLRTNHDSATLDWAILNPTTCGHVLCRACLNRLLLSPPPPSRSRAAAQTGSTCTLGQCPVCRSQVSYFDALDYVTRQPLVTSRLDERLLGAVFLEVGLPGVGWSSLHFPTIEGSTSSKCADQNSVGEPHVQNKVSSHDVSECDAVVPYLNCDQVPGTAETGRPLRVSFASSMYHAPTHTWQGQATYQCHAEPTDTMDAEVAANLPLRMTWRFILTFSDNFKFVTQGVLIRTTTYPTAATVSQTEQLPSPPAQRSAPWTQTEIVPMGGEKGSLMLRLHDELLVPTTNLPDTSIPQLNSLERPHRPVYHANSVWGNTYCQFLQVGLMSLHFVRPPGKQSETIDSQGDTESDNGLVYMSFEHAGLARTPPLDNGHPLPSRLLCRNIEYSDDHATPWVRGEFDWLEDAGSPWQDMARMMLHVQFDRQFLCIVSGTIQQQCHDDGHLGTLMNFSHSHSYCNAALYNFFHTTTLGLPEVEDRLRHEGASDGVWNLVSKVALAAKHDIETNECTDPMDYNER